MLSMSHSRGKQRPGGSAFLSKFSAGTDLSNVVLNGETCQQQESKNLQQLPQGLGACLSSEEVQLLRPQVLPVHAGDLGCAISGMCPSTPCIHLSACKDPPR